MRATGARAGRTCRPASADQFPPNARKNCARPGRDRVRSDCRNRPPARERDPAVRRRIDEASAAIGEIKAVCSRPAPPINCASQSPRKARAFGGIAHQRPRACACKGCRPAPRAARRPRRGLSRNRCTPAIRCATARTPRSHRLRRSSLLIRRRRIMPHDRRRTCRARRPRQSAAKLKIAFAASRLILARALVSFGAARMQSEIARAQRAMQLANGRGARVSVHQRAGAFMRSARWPASTPEPQNTSPLSGPRRGAAGILRHQQTAKAAHPHKRHR